MSPGYGGGGPWMPAMPPGQQPGSYYAPGGMAPYAMNPVQGMTPGQYPQYPPYPQNQPYSQYQQNPQYPQGAPGQGPVPFLPPGGPANVPAPAPGPGTGTLSDPATPTASPKANVVRRGAIPGYVTVTDSSNGQSYNMPSAVTAVRERPHPKAEDHPRFGGLSVRAPASAHVFVNDVELAGRGEIRSHNPPEPLLPGVPYKLNVRVEVRQGAVTLKKTETVWLRPGMLSELTFEFPEFRNEAPRSVASHH